MKRGFTLIELLAVIVILAIIALIAVPIILEIINDAREESNKRSVELYANAVRNAVAAYQLTGLNEPKSFSDLTIEYDGDVKCTVQELYEDGSFYLEGCKVNNGDKEYSYGTKQGDNIVKLCTANTTKATALVWRGDASPYEETSYEREEIGLLASDGDAYAKGVAYTCNFIDDSEENNMTFFVLSSTENEVTLILGSNLGGNVAWCSDETKCKTDGIWDNTKGPITANEALADRTSTWNKLTDEQKSTIKLPTKDQIESAYEGTVPKWLNNSNTIAPLAYPYWTSTPDASYFSTAWIVYVRSNGSDTLYGNSGIDYSLGVRPVITLSKSVIN